MIRAFIAMDIPEDVRGAVEVTQARLKEAHTGVKVSWAKIENAHLTLQFLGNVDEALIGRIRATLDGVTGEHKPFEITMAGVGAFPDENRARVLWVGCRDDAGRLKALAGGVQRAMEPLGFRPEHREFSAHLTMGRVKFPKPDAALTRALDSIKNEAFGTMRVEAIHLFRSELHPDGSIYSKLSSHQLGERHHAAKD